MISGQKDTEAVYRAVVGEGLAPPEENETGINGFAQYIISADTFFLQNSVTPSAACGATFPYTIGDGFVLSQPFFDKKIKFATGDLAPPEKNETGINGYFRYEIYCKTVGAVIGRP